VAAAAAISAAAARLLPREVQLQAQQRRRGAGVGGVRLKHAAEALLGARGRAGPSAEAAVVAERLGAGRVRHDDISMASA
jgi:hypothetical protein